MAELTIQTPDGRRRVFRLRRDEVVVGRDATCDVVLDDTACSRRHLRIHSPRAGQYVLEDLGSHNGTYVNDEQTPTRELVHGDEIRIGRCLLGFADRPSSSQPTVDLIDDEGDLTSISVYRHKPSISESRLNQLLQLSDRLVGALEHREVLERAMDICMESLRFDRGLIVEAPKRSGTWQLPVVRNVRQGEGCSELTISRSILSRAIEHGERSVISSAQADSGDLTESMVRNEIRSALCVPITWRTEVLGAIYGDRLTHAEEYSEDDVNYLAGLAAQIGAALKTSQLVQEAQVRRRIENDLTVARQIQEGLFPKALPVRDDLEVVAYNSPGRSVSGDYYDMIVLDDGRIGMVIADVSGKGVPAAMLMANLQAAVRITLPGADDIVTVVRRLNQLVHENTNATKFITALLGVLDVSERTIRYVNAGHYPPYRVHADGRVESLPDEAGLPLGVDRDADYPLVTVPLGDEATTLFLFTDGIPEALNQDDEFYGLGRIEDLLKRNARADATELVARCRRAIAEFVGHAPQSDDLTLMTVRLGQARRGTP